MSKLKIAESQTKTDLTKTQRESGEYPKGKVTLKDIDITIENPKGTYRSGYSEGKHWKSLMNYTYGFINDSLGRDGDEVDIFLGPLAEKKVDFLVYIISQVDPKTKEFDEHKVMFGFNSSSEAKKAYLSCYEEGWQGYGSMSQINLINFKTWIKKNNNKVLLEKFKSIDNKIESGEKLKLIKLEGEVLLDKTLLDLQFQAGDLKKITTLILSIESPGGDVSEGIKIMMWLDELSNRGIKVVTIVLSNAYSIASLIMLAADHTLIAKDADVMVHNPMIPELKLVNANELEEYIRDLRLLESTMYELYEIFTDLSLDEIKKLMDNETYINAKEAVKLGFADEIADIEKRPKVMAKSKTKTINMKKTLNTLNKVLAMVSNSAIVNQMYYNNEGGEIEIYQQDPSAYKTGDRTSVQNGEIKLQDGSLLVIEDYIIKEIKKDVTEPAATEPTTTEPTTAEPVVSFNQGPAPVVEEPAMKTEVTKTETTKTEPVAVVEEPVAVVEEPVAVVEEPVAVVEEPATPSISSEDFQSLLKNFQELSLKYDELSKRVESLESNSSKSQEQMEDTEEFKELATAAIEMIAKNTSSKFVPEAKAASVEVSTGGSIFQQAKAKALAAKKR